MMRVGTFFSVMRIRSSISKSLRGYSKNSKTSHILGCEYNEFLNYLNNNPYNFKYGDGGYDIDHIIPISSSDTEEEVFKLNHYTNFQLLPSDYNRYIKSDNEWDSNHFEKWLENNSLKP